MRSRAVRWIESLMVLALVGYAVEILVRRWAWNQIPSQVPGWSVYGLVVANFLIAGCWWSFRYRGRDSD